MSTLNIFQIEKSFSQIRETLLTNVIKMLTERGLLNKENLDKNIKKLVNTQSDDYVFYIDIDNPQNETEKKYLVKIFFQKISSISKQSTIIEFLEKNKDIHKIIIVKSINPKSGDTIVSDYRNTELFLEHELMLNLRDYDFVPRYQITDETMENFQTDFCNLYKCKKRNIPKLFVTDPVARYYNLQRGQIVRIIRPSDTSGKSASYRITV